MAKARTNVGQLTLDIATLNKELVVGICLAIGQGDNAAGGQRYQIDGFSALLHINGGHCKNSRAGGEYCEDFGLHREKNRWEGFKILKEYIGSGRLCLCKNVRQYHATTSRELLEFIFCIVISKSM